MEWMQLPHCSLTLKALTFILTPTNSMGQSPSSEADRFSTNHKISRILCNPKFHYAFTLARLLSLSRSWSIPSISPTHFLKIHFNVTLQSTRGSDEWSPNLSSPNQKKRPICTSPRPIRATCPAHSILLDLITRIILSERYRSQSPSLCSLLHCPVTLSFLGPNSLLRTLSKSLSLCSSVVVSDQVSHPYRTRGKIMNFYGKCIKSSFTAVQNIQLLCVEKYDTRCSHQLRESTHNRDINGDGLWNIQDVSNKDMLRSHMGDTWKKTGSIYLK